MKNRNIKIKAPGLALIWLVLAAAGLQAQEATAVTVRSLTGLRAAGVMDPQGSTGWALQIRSGSFVGDSPFYWGFGSVTGSLGSDALFETAALTGFWIPLKGTGLALDASLDLIAFGGRVNTGTLKYLGETPGITPGIALVFLADQNWGVSLGTWTTLRPYNGVDGAWNFGRSYWGGSLTFEFRSRFEAKPLPWSF